MPGGICFLKIFCHLIGNINVKQYLDVLTQFNMLDNRIEGQGQRLMVKFKVMLIISVNLIIMTFDWPK